MGRMSTAPRSAAVRHDWGHDETGCTVLHVDMDAFYASCEMARHPELRGLPLIIGTGARAVVSAASYEARAFGVNSAMPVARARQLCPQGVFLPVDMTYYRGVSRAIFAVMEQVTDRIERTSVDEGYMDVRGALLRWERPTAIGAWIRAEVSRRFHVTCSVGVASNKMVAKIASTNAKPDGMLLIPVARQAEFVRMLPLRSIPGIGPAVGRRFAAWGVNSVADLAQLTEPQIARITGSPAGAHALWLAARGESEHVVTPHTPEKSIGSERTLAEDTSDWREVAALLRRAGDEVASSLRRKGLMARTLSVKVRFADLSYATRTRALDEATDLASAIIPQACALTRALLGMGEHDGFTPRRIRLAGLSVSGLVDRATTAVQPSLETLLEEEEDGLPEEAPGIPALPVAGAASTRRRALGRRLVIDGQPTLFDDGDDCDDCGDAGDAGAATDGIVIGEASTGDVIDDGMHDGAARDEATPETPPAASQPHPTTRRRQAERALDAIHARYGKDAAKLGL